MKNSKNNKLVYSCTPLKDGFVLGKEGQRRVEMQKKEEYQVTHEAKVFINNRIAERQLSRKTISRVIIQSFQFIGYPVYLKKDVKVVGISNFKPILA